MKHLKFFLMLIGLLSPILAGCAPTSNEPGVTNKEIILATTTSTYDSGLLDELIPPFEEDTGYIVKIVSVGTGKALTMGREGNADLLLVHAPASEVEFMDGGYGIERQLVMHNDFVIVGPLEDPAGIQGEQSPSQALRVIAESGSIFVSRGDDSGTHKKELSLWEVGDLTPSGDWYLESGQGMGATLQIASEKNGYTLTDRATFLALSDTLSLQILVEGDSSLLNIYHVMIVNPDLWPEINLEGARALSAYLVSDEGQAIIESFGIAKFGQPLFFPDADKEDADFGLE